MLRVLGVSRNGYYAFKARKPTESQLRKEMIFEEIWKIYEDSHQNYGAPKITQVLLGKGICVSEKTVGNYVRELGIKAQYVKPYTKTTIDPNFSDELKNILDGNQRFSHVLQNIKIHHAKEYLDNTNYKIEEIAPLVGYDSVDHLSRTFKKICGVTPSKYRKH